LVAGAFPIVFSLLSDIYGPKQRAIVSSVVQISTGVGLAAGQGVSGVIGPAFGWRLPFVLVAAPAIVVAVIMSFMTKEPIRGYNELHFMSNGVSPHQQYSEHISWPKLKVLLGTPTNVLCILQGLPGCLPWGILLTFLNDFLAQEKGISVAKATSVVLMVGVGGACGVIAGGVLGQYIYNRAKWGMPVFIGTTTVFASLPLWFLVNTDVKNFVQTAYLAAFSAGALSSTVGPNIRAMIMNVNEPETRGVALALQSTLDDLGKGLGPALISRLGRLQAFNIAAVGWIPCGLLLVFTAFTLSRDERQMRQRILAPNLEMEPREMELSERDLE
jgi:predicted MFS family arabinose efflux permease